MGFFSWLFGPKRPQTPSRYSRAVKRLARRRRVSVDLIDLTDGNVIEELLLLGLVLSDDGGYYYDDSDYVDLLDEDQEITDVDEPVFVAASGSTFDDEVDSLAEQADEIVAEGSAKEVDLYVVPDIEDVTESAASGLGSGVNAPDTTPPAPTGSVWTDNSDSNSDRSSSSGSSWTDTTERSSWGGSSDSGSSYDSGGGDSDSGGGDD